MHLRSAELLVFGSAVILIAGCSSTNGDGGYKSRTDRYVDAYIALAEQGAQTGVDQLNACGTGWQPDYWAMKIVKGTRELPEVQQKIILERFRQAWNSRIDEWNSPTPPTPVLSCQALSSVNVDSLVSLGR